ncbi:hypothetical protein SUGI_1053710 [Cryptomeria japonica]|nr:hypothetical protein SUGI_1053710 [Cryptomeria japonica]
MTKHRKISRIFPNFLRSSSRLLHWGSNGFLTDLRQHHSRHLFSTQPPQPSNPNFTSQPNKHYIYHGQRTQSIKRPSVKGFTFTNTRSKPWTYSLSRKPELKPFRTDLWDPQTFNPKLNRTTLTANEINFKTGRGLSAIARYVCESFSKHKIWGPEILEDLKKLHRVTPNVVTEVLKGW